MRAATSSSGSSLGAVLAAVQASDRPSSASKASFGSPYGMAIMFLRLIMSQYLSRTSFE